MATHSSTLAWKIPWKEEPGGLQSMGLLRVGHDWATSLTFHFHALEKEMATHSSVLAWRILGTGEPGRLPSMGLHRVGHDWSDLATYKRIRIRLKSNISAETQHTRREWQYMLKMKKGKNLQPRLLYLASIIFKFKRDRKSFTSKEKLREFRTAKKLYNKV